MTDRTDRSTPEAVLEAVAADLRAAERAGAPIPPIRDRIAETDEPAAYRVQQINVAQRLAAGARVAGRKVGLTARAVQRQLGVDRPDFGTILDDMVFGDGEPIPHGRVLQPKAEAEVALVLGRDLDIANPGWADVVRAVDFALPAIEVVGSRIADWDIRFSDTVADNGSSGLIVLGGPPVPLDRVDLQALGMVLERRGEEVSTGAGAACLGHPLNAAVWLARKAWAMGLPLRAGETIMTGALGPMVPAAPGDVFEARMPGLGTVRAVFDTEE